MDKSNPTVQSAELHKKWPNLPVRHLVLATDEFIVFIDPDGDVDWETSDAFDERPRKDAAKHNAVLNEAALLETTPCDYLDETKCLNFKRLIGEAIARAFDEDYKNAFLLLAKARTYIARRNLEKARFWYLSAAGTMSGAIALLGFFVWLGRESLFGLIGETAVYCIISMSAGAMGSLLSVTFRLGKVRMDASAGRDLHLLEGCFRSLAGFISALLAALAIRAGLLLPVLGNVHQTHTGMVIAGFLAGASERWVSSLIAKFEAPEQQHNGKRDEQSESQGE